MGFIANLVLGFGRIIQIIFTSSSLIGIGLFTLLSFHYEQKKKFSNLCFALIFLLSVIRIPIIIFKEINLDPITHYISVITYIITLFTTFIWLAYSSNTFLKSIKKVEIEPWIKFRYKLITYSSIIFPFHSIWVLFQPWDVEFADPTNLYSVVTFSLMTLFSAGFGLGMLIAWIMPKTLKKYINKRQGYVKEQELDLTEEELMQLLKDQISGGA